MVIANNDELEGGGNSPDVLVVTTFHFLLAKDFYHKSDVCLHSSINRQNTPTHSLKIHIFCDIFFLVRWVLKVLRKENSISS